MHIFNTKSILQLAVVILVLATLSTHAFACDEHKNNAQPVANHQSINHAEHQTAMSENAYATVMDKMHKSMMIEGTGERNIPHEQLAHHTY